MNQTEIIIHNTGELEEAARQFVGVLGERRHVAFHAPMGAGKTTFIAALCRVLGMEDETSSPTFSIINEYHAASDGMKSAGGHAIDRVYHFDFYRIETPEEALDLGLDDYFDSEALCLMEWPGNVEGFLPDDTVEVSIEVEDDGTRRLMIQEP